MTPTTTQRRKPVLGTVLLLFSLPLVLVLVDGVSFYVANRSNGAFVSSGQKREYLLYVPPSYDPARPTPLVISMHGAGLWGTAQKDISQWNQVADREGLIVVYPSGAAGNGPRVWHMERDAGPNRDVRFIAALIDTLEAAYNIDPARIYADGLSNGGGMAFVLSCTLPDRIAAVGLVASAQLLPWSWCTDHRPVPMIAFHGTADRFAPYAGGRSWVAPDYRFPSIPAWTANWARRNRCGPVPIASVVAADVTRLAYPNCADDAAVVLYRVQGGGHTWPGGGSMPEWFAGPTSQSIDATGLMWEFFRAHRRVRRASPPDLQP
ncbi:MAG TPA: PHB depolymerase family esterase [Gemmatimonadales bacterium]|nr:PHB depolymerase family esterase [Gemmatimonadales bacterium]